MAVEYKPEVFEYHKPDTRHAMFEDIKLEIRRVKEEGNLRRSTRQRRISSRLQDCEVFLNNEVTNSGDLVHFAFIA